MADMTDKLVGISSQNIPVRCLEGSDRAKCPQDVPRCLQDVPKMSPRCLEDVPRMSLSVPKKTEFYERKKLQTDFISPIQKYICTRNTVKFLYKDFIKAVQGGGRESPFNETFS